ncbi:MAG: DUF378 domain-containing protein [Candidatus Pacearchaeota archaeon]
MVKKSVIDWIALVLVIIGGLNWGLVGIDAGWNVVNLIFGSVAWLESLIYILVGIAALWMIYFAVKE